MVLKMVFNFMKAAAKNLNKKLNRTLCDLAVGESGILETFDMPQSIAEHLMNLGFVPGLEVFGGPQRPRWQSARLPCGWNRSGPAPRPLPMYCRASFTRSRDEVSGECSRVGSRDRSLSEN